MGHSSDLYAVGSLTAQGFPVVKNYFGQATFGQGKSLGFPTTSRVELFSGSPIATTTNALATSQTLAGSTNAVLLATLTVTGVSVTAVGTGYAQGDILTATGGTSTSTATFLVQQVNGGQVVGVSILNPGIYSVAPTGVSGGNGTGVTLAFAVAQTTVQNVTVYKLDYARQVTVGFASSPATNITFLGYDILGNKQSEVVAVTSTSTSAHSAKTYSALYSVQSSSATALTTFVVGVGNVFGLPLAVKNATYVQAWTSASGINAVDGGTVTTAVTTNPATATSGDPRGTYTPAFTTNGTQQLNLYMDLPFNYLNYTANPAVVNPIWSFGVPNYFAGGF